MKTFLPLAVVLLALGVWSQDCGVNEVRHDCGPVCESCGDSTCDAVRCGGGCWCQSGYLRDRIGTCIPMDKCPDDANDEPDSRQMRQDSSAGSCWHNACSDRPRVTVSPGSVLME
ncbi:Protease inhibitor cysteine-rich trypsin inhibitor [Cordyceps militaris]|uniref:Protease inhibitor cysteine-rich trypsin inhibitor n=1 Tax=Cordyceps militaris TaxID=73501 RepID=A0A2H4SMR5_CORMI|nr:Protease inhibitor cysteine-rich trypsin inhibitor [Cordyceps militaris]